MMFLIVFVKSVISVLRAATLYVASVCVHHRILFKLANMLFHGGLSEFYLPSGAKDLDGPRLQTVV